MKKLGPRGQKILKTFHLVAMGLWVGGAAALNFMLVSLVPDANGPDPLGFDLARKFVDDCIIIPGAMGCLVSGLLISWLTPWGFFKHRWVAVKWILTVGCILFGTFYLGPRVNAQPVISAVWGAAALGDPVYLANKSANIWGGCAQLLLVLFMTAISVLKPWKKKASSHQ